MLIISLRMYDFNSAQGIDNWIVNSKSVLASNKTLNPLLLKELKKLKVA